MQVALVEGWRALTPGELAPHGAQAVAGFVREDEAARLLVLRGAPISEPLEAAGATLRRRLRDEIADYRHIAQTAVDLPAGPALTTSYARVRAGTAESITLVSRDDCCWSLMTTVAAGEDEAAEQVAAMVASFGPHRYTPAVDR